MKPTRIPGSANIGVVGGLNWVKSSRFVPDSVLGEIGDQVAKGWTTMLNPPV